MLPIAQAGSSRQLAGALAQSAQAGADPDAHSRQSAGPAPWPEHSPDLRTGARPERREARRRAQDLQHQPPDENIAQVELAIQRFQTPRRQGNSSTGTSSISGSISSTWAMRTRRRLVRAIGAHRTAASSGDATNPQAVAMLRSATAGPDLARARPPDAIDGHGAIADRRCPS